MIVFSNHESLSPNEDSLIKNISSEESDKTMHDFNSVSKYWLYKSLMNVKKNKTVYYQNKGEHHCVCFVWDRVVNICKKPEQIS